MNPKYVITEFHGITRVHILFAAEQHCNVVNNDIEVVSAGFFSFFVNDDNVVDIFCYGESVTLGIQSQPDKDVFCLKQFFNLER
jgi:hypothetical protein